MRLPHDVPVIAGGGSRQLIMDDKNTPGTVLRREKPDVRRNPRFYSFNCTSRMGAVTIDVALPAVNVDVSSEFGVCLPRAQIVNGICIRSGHSINMCTIHEAKAGS